MNHSTIFQKLVLAAGLLISGYLAWRGLFHPADLMNIAEVSVDTAAARNEIRGQYGGFYAALALLLFLCLTGALRARLGIIFMVFLFGGVLFGRLLTLFLDGYQVFQSYPPAIKSFYIFDTVGLLISLAALRGSKEPRRFR